MSVKGIIMFLGMNNTRLERKLLIILDFENGFLPTYLPQCAEFKEFDTNEASILISMFTSALHECFLGLHIFSL